MGPKVELLSRSFDLTNNIQLQLLFCTTHHLHKFLRSQSDSLALFRAWSMLSALIGRNK